MIINTVQGGGGYGTLPAQISSLYATIGAASVKLTWSNPVDDNFAGVLIVRKTGGYPSKPGDGTKIYQGTAQTFTDTGLENGTQYYYRAFSYNSKKEYQTEYCVATMTPLAGYTLGSFPVGTKIKFGSVSGNPSGNPIVQKIVNKSGNDITLISNGVVGKYAFDAAEPLNSDSYRQVKGNNRYKYSNIHQWLNSEAGAGSWYTAQHSADQAPDSTSYVTANPYSSKAGYMNGFSEKEKNYLKTKTVTVGIPALDGGGTETITARIWLPSATEVGYTGLGYTEGTQLSAFSDNESRISSPAASYYLRTPHSSASTSYTSIVRTVNSAGAQSYIDAYNGGDFSVRPLCVLDSSVLCSLSVDGNGCYTVL